ncbi:MAG: lipoyl(octanoyl) transferase LipB [Desulfuromonadales bacterium]|nr:lipoyl(octanoyl) transferase LipB [Desulfuromonadales bacterium]
MQELLLDRRRQAEEDILILLEHPPVITLGRGATTDHLLLSSAELTRRGIEVTEARRGGDITWHGPGQLVGYPIVDLQVCGRDLHRFLRQLEQLLIRTLAVFGVTGERVAGKTGVWAEGEKIASIGIGVRRWVSWHGFALNVSTDLSGFATIVPCGLPGVAMTSLERQVGRPVPLVQVQEAVIAAFAEVFACRYAGEYELDPP